MQITEFLRGLIIGACAAFIVSGSVILVTGARAQQQPAFVPYTITAEQHKQIIDYLMELPAKYANPLLNTLAQYEQAAQEAKKQSGEDKPKE